MGQSVQPERLSFLNFLERLPNSQFVIPVYQRNYTWRAKKEVKKYLEDYNSILNGTKTSHFIGIMMYLALPKGIGFSELSVVDGQQRLVTTFLILHCLKKIAMTNGDTIAGDRINEQYLINKYSKEADLKLKLKPLISDDDVYIKIVSDNEEAITKEEKKSNVYVNYRYIYSYLSKLYGSYSIDQLVTAINGFYLVVIPLGHEDKVQEIFETINSAGMALSKSDLIRNYLLMNTDSEYQEKLYREYWRPLELKLNEKIENFFRMFLAGQLYSLPNMEEIYHDFQKWHSQISKAKNIEEILKMITKYSNYYYNLYFDTKLSLPNDLTKAIVEFRRSSIEPAAPLLLKIYDLYQTLDEDGNSLVSKEQFINILNLITTYNIRRNIVNLRTGVLTRIVPPLLKDVLDECNGEYSNIDNICVKYLVDNNKEKASFMPDDEYIKNNLHNMNAYALKNYVKIIFEKIESHNNPAVIDFSNLSIEHLMPQTPTEEWLKILNISEEDYEHNLHRLGNLTLAVSSDNSKMQNNPFEYKKSILKNTSHIKMNNEILQKTKWDVEEINNRTTELIRQICELYPYKTYGKVITKSYNICYKDGEVKLSGLINLNGTVEIKEGSIFKSTETNEITDLIDNEIITEKNDAYIFLVNYSFENLETASQILLPNLNLDPWEVWKDTVNKSLNLNIRLKIKYNNL